MVALGCPKQEQWMTAHKHQINAVMIGLGGVFLYMQVFTKELRVG